MTDGELSDSQNITVTVNPVNDAPVLSSIGDQELSEDGTLNILLSAFDIEGDVLEYSIQGGNNISVSLSGSELVFAPAQDFNGNETFTVTLSLIHI